MADSYLEFSEVVTHLTESEVSWLQNQLEIVNIRDGKEGADPADATWAGCRAYRDMPDYDGEFGGDVGFDCSFSDEVDEKIDEKWGRYLWIRSEEHGYVDRVAHLVQKFLRKFRPADCWSLTYAATCSKPRVGEFGGGAFFVTASDIKWFGSWCFVDEEEGKFRNGADGKAGNAKSTRVVVNVSGGAVQDVYCSDPQADIVIVDWDTEGCDPNADNLVAVAGGPAYVTNWDAQPLAAMKGTDVGLALSLSKWRT